MSEVSKASRITNTALAGKDSLQDGDTKKTTKPVDCVPLSPGAIKERKLEPWKPDGMCDDDDNDGKFCLDGDVLSPKWDQFKANEEKFGCKSSFSEDYYTTVLDKSYPEFGIKARRAEKIAKEILSQTCTNVHVAEERNLISDSDQEADEETKYGSVIRSSSDVYLPPSLRKKQQNCVSGDGKNAEECLSKGHTENTQEPCPREDFTKNCTENVNSGHTLDEDGGSGKAADKNERSSVKKCPTSGSSPSSSSKLNLNAPEFIPSKDRSNPMGHANVDQQISALSMAAHPSQAYMANQMPGAPPYYQMGYYHNSFPSNPYAQMPYVPYVSYNGMMYYVYGGNPLFQQPIQPSQPQRQEEQNRTSSDSTFPAE